MNPAAEQDLLVSASARIATLTVNQPGKGNALSLMLRRRLRETVAALDADDAIDVLILTGADPAFCAGIDLDALGTLDDSKLAPSEPRGLLGPHAKPALGAINGVCDHRRLGARARSRLAGGLTASELRRHERPGWGSAELTVLLPQAVGVPRARELSVTARRLGAVTARDWSLVNHLVDHRDLHGFRARPAADVVANRQAAMRRVRETYDRCAATTIAQAWAVQTSMARGWAATQRDRSRLQARRREMLEHGRTRQQPGAR
jgi:enoyl-CoA hydratase